MVLPLTQRTRVSTTEWLCPRLPAWQGCMKSVSRALQFRMVEEGHVHSPFAWHCSPECEQHSCARPIRIAPFRTWQEPYNAAPPTAFQWERQLCTLESGLTPVPSLIWSKPKISLCFHWHKKHGEGESLLGLSLEGGGNSFLDTTAKAQSTKLKINWISSKCKTMSHHEENLITGRKYWQIIHLLEDVYPKYKEHFIEYYSRTQVIQF